MTPGFRHYLALARALALGLSCAASRCAAADYVVYCSSANPAAGDGSPGNPYQSLASVAWSSAATAAASGGKAQVWLQNGSVFTGAYSIAGSGISGNPIVVDAYPGPSAERPIIQGALTALTGWTAYGGGLGQTWQVAGASANLACANGIPQVRGASAATLNQGEWYYASSVVYYRNDLGNPDALGTVFSIASPDQYPLSLTDRAYVTLNNLQVKYGGTIVLNIAAGGVGCTAITLSNCVFSGAGGWLLSADSVTNLVVKNSVFTYGMGSGGWLYFVGSKRPSSWAFDYCLFDLQRGASRGGVTGTGAHAGRFNNCDFLSSVNEFFANAGTSVVGFTNCIFSGSTAGNTRYNPVLVNSGSGALNLSDCIVLGNGKSVSTNAFFQNCTLAGPVYYADPQFRATRMPGFLAFTTDDCVNSADWVDLAVHYANPNGIPMSLALDMLHIGEADTNGVQQQLLLGHEVMNHTKSHASLTNKHGLTLQAAQAGVATATLLVSNHAGLYVTTNGVTLYFDLTAETNRTLYRLGTNLAAQGFTTANFAYGADMTSTDLTNVSGANILTNYPVPLDYARFIQDEVYDQQIAIGRYFTNANGTPYTPRTLAYPYGQFDSQAVTNLTNTFIACRSTINNMQYLAQGINLYNMYILSPFALSALLLFENNLTDSALAGGDWTAGSLAYDAAVKRRGGYSAAFNGASRYATKAASYYSQIQAGDWQICAWVYPVLTSQGTLFYQRNDANNHLTIYWDAAGAAHLRLVANGVAVVDLATPPGALTGAGWQRLRVEELFDEWTIRVDGALQARALNTNRPPIYTGDLYLGCALDAAGGRVNYANGWVDNFHFANGTYRRMLSLCAQLCDQGEVGAVLSHGQDNVPNEVYDVIFRAVRDYTGDLRVMRYDRLVDWLRANGTLVAATNLYLAPFANQDYRLRKTSPAIGAANAAAFAGNANRYDLYGARVADEAGNVTLKRPAIGASQFPDTRAVNNRRLLRQF